LRVVADESLVGSAHFVGVIAVLASSGEPVRVVIAGGGFAALEAALALRAFAADRVRVTLISPDPVFAYRPTATAEAFVEGPPLSYDLEAIASDLGACQWPSVSPQVRPSVLPNRGHLFCRVAGGNFTRRPPQIRT